MHACSCYWGSEVLGCRTLRLESQSNAALRMQPYPRSLDLVFPGHLNGTGCLSARAMGTGFSIFVWRLCMGPGWAWVWVPVSPSALAGALVGCVWVRVDVAPFFSGLGFAVFAAGLRFRPASHYSWLRCWGVRGCVCPQPVLRRSRFGCAVWACVFTSPPSPLVFFFCVVACRVVALWCQSRCPWGSRPRCSEAGGFCRLLWRGWAVSWLWAFLVSPRPAFFWGGGLACSSLCPPWAGAGTGRHSVFSSGLLLVCRFCQVLPRPHGLGGLCTRWARRPFLVG